VETQPVVAAAGGDRRRVRARVEGTVQGVGFRPYLYRVAGELGLGGFALNDARGVELEVEGEGAAVERFFERLAPDAPPLAAVERVLREEREPTGAAGGFAIVASAREGEAAALIAPDTATCVDCLAELLDPGDRRHRYPFINCTNCGPRFTIVRGVPYDRPLTTMAGFTMCERCRAEYDDPADRRFHAQPNACPACGPAVRLTDAAGEPVDATVPRPADDTATRAVDDAATAPSAATAGDPIAAAATALRAGLIVAVKGLGGLHLACRADDEGAVARLRDRKHREDKPFALMVADLDAAGALVDLEPAKEKLLAARERPIVLAPRRAHAPVADAVAPGARELGVMLPYSPLHHLLLADAGTTLVMTSGNVSDEPIAYRDDEALERLAAIADRFLLHDRPIHMRTDDSVVRAVSLPAGRRTLTLRRSRGYVPQSLELAAASERPLLACGAELKSTFCVAKQGRAWVGHHIGDLRNWETLRSFREGVAHFERLFAVEPEIVAHDLHPDYLSTGYALEREGVEHVGVQHHHAHLAACLAEHGEEGPAIGVVYDGTGYGTDGTVWGGELLVGDLAGFERAGHLWPVRLPGGERAVREPWRMACAWLAEAGYASPPLPAALRDAVAESSWRAVSELVRTGTAAPITTSAGRLFDAVAALCGLRPRVNYEGQAAVELEAAADPGERGAYPLPVAIGGQDGGGAEAVVLDARATILGVQRDAFAGAPLPTIAARFHNALADASARACATIAERRGLATVVLSGGVFQNRLLLERTAALVADAGLRVLTPERLPPNDGGIAYGQAAVAAFTPR